jgi:methanogenic corrinoid protein MtbC1
MPVQQRGQVKQALGLYDKSTADVTTLKSQFSETDVSSIVAEVLNRVKAKALRDETLVDRPSKEKVERLCYALISDDGQEGHKFIESVYEDGASLDAIYLSYLAAAAEKLGEWWKTDDASFYEVTIGTSRIYAIMRALSYLFVPMGNAEVKSAVFACIPGETHILGVRMAADLFIKDGWDVKVIVGKDHQELVDEIADSQCRIIGLSAAGAHSTAALARAVIALRLSNPSAGIFLGGQITQEAKQAVDLMGFDGIMSDIPTALAIMNSYRERSVMQ